MRLTLAAAAIAATLLLTGTAGAQNATPPSLGDSDATWDYWHTVEATDLTEIAGEESAVLTELAESGTSAAATSAAAATATESAAQSRQKIFLASPSADQPTPTGNEIARQLPDTGAGDEDNHRKAWLFGLGFALGLAAFLAGRRRPNRLD